MRENMSDVEPRLRAILTDLLGIEGARITPLSRFRDDFGADSLQVVEIILSVEDAFDVLLTEATGEIATVGEVIELITAHRAT